MAVSNRKFNGTYNFSSQPKALLYREKIGKDGIDNYEQRYGNIMFDRRVVRGLTKQTSFQKMVVRHNRLVKKNQNKREYAGTPPPVEGRKHIEVETCQYLEALANTVVENDVQCQTDDFLDRPPSPLYIPVSAGIDQSTEILPKDLFSFDIEVRPLLEVLVGKTIEQALLEVAEEEELEAIREQQFRLQEIRSADLVEQQRLEERERRYSEEKERRRMQHLEAQTKHQEVSLKLAAMAFSKMYLEPLVPSVYDFLYENGYFYDVVERDVEDNFLPWLMCAIEENLEFEVDARRLLDLMICEVVTEQQQAYRNLEITTLETRQSDEKKNMFTRFGVLEETNKKEESSKITLKPIAVVNPGNVSQEVLSTITPQLEITPPDDDDNDDEEENENAMD